MFFINSDLDHVPNIAQRGHVRYGFVICDENEQSRKSKKRLQEMQNFLISFY